MKITRDDVIVVQFRIELEWDGWRVVKIPHSLQLTDSQVPAGARLQLSHLFWTDGVLPDYDTCFNFTELNTVRDGCEFSSKEVVKFFKIGVFTLEDK